MHTTGLQCYLLRFMSPPHAKAIMISDDMPSGCASVSGTDTEHGRDDVMAFNLIVNSVPMTIQACWYACWRESYFLIIHSDNGLISWINKQQQ